jgi:L-asparaginase
VSGSSVTPARLALLATGGTIACTLDAHGRAVKTLRAADLLARAGADGVTAVDHGLLSSWDIGPADMLDMARRVDQLLAEHDGVVVTHGTDTLEETAALLSFAVRSAGAVVVTGAMRAADEPGSDGAANLRDALAVAGHPDAAGRGALVTFAGEVHAGTRVTKGHSSALAAFASPGTGPVGLVQERRVEFLAPPRPPTRYDVAAADADVPLLTAAPGVDERVVEAALERAQGLVVAGMGLGHLPSAWMPLLGDAVGRGVPVVRATRTGEGPVGGRYAGPGGDLDAEERGLLSAGFRPPYLARIELICALGAGVDPAEAFGRPLP